MEFKTVKHILPAQTIDMGGFPVKQALPTNLMEQFDPFLLLHHGQIKPIHNRPANVQGVGPHPHRGFSPVTFVIEGEVHHRDSRNNSQIAKQGEVQWMHAGAGIIHSERPSQELIDAKGKQEIIQLWVNSPASSKMSIPSYTHISNEDFPRINNGVELSELKLVAGEYMGMKGKAQPESELIVAWGTTQKNGQVEFKVPDGFNAAIYSIKGSVRVEGHGVIDPESFVIFGEDGDTITLHGKTDTQYLILAGKPINEKLAQHGPFVMNTQTEIMEAMRDYQMGKMGILIEDEL